MASNDHFSILRPNKRIKKEMEELNHQSKSNHNKTDLILEMSWNLRDRLQNQLSLYTAMLYSKIGYNDEMKRRLINENRMLINELMSLNVTSKDGKFRKKIFQTPTTTTNDEKRKEDSFNCLPNLPMLELRWSLRQQLFDNLALNQHSAIIYSEETSEDAKKALIKENSQIAFALMELPVKNNEQDKSAETDDDTISNSSTRETSNGHKESDLDTKLNGLKDEIVKLVDRSINARPEIVFTFKVSNMKNFLLSNEKRESEMFYCRNIPFFVAAQSRLVVDKKTSNTGFIDVFLHCEYIPTGEWRCNTKIFMKLISNACDVNEITSKFDFEFTKRNGVGLPLVSHQDLQNAKRQQIKDDSFCIQVNLICDKPVGA